MKISKELTESITLKFNQLVSEKVKAGERIISLGLGEPSFKTPDAIVEATIQALREGNTKYSDSRGLLELREKISEKFLLENGFDVSPNNIVVTLGAKQALIIALMSILEPGDEVINLTPCYGSYIPQIKIAEPDSIIHNIDHSRHDFSIPFELIKHKLSNKTKAILFNYPHNPLGKILTEDDALHLMDILKKYPDCYIISDEIYEYLNFSGVQHISVQKYQELSERVFTINGLSKSFSMTGWRIGYMSVPRNRINVVVKLLLHINTDIPTFIQKGSITAFEIDKSFITEYNTMLKSTFNYIDLKLNSICPNFVKSSGGLFSFLNISNTGFKSDRFASQLLAETNVAVNPGVAFGENWDDYVRVSTSCEYEIVKQGIDLLAEFMKAHT